MSSRSFSAGSSLKDPQLPSNASAAVPLGTIPRGTSLEPLTAGGPDRAWIRRGSTASSLTRDASDPNVGAARSSSTDDREVDTGTRGMGSELIMCPALYIATEAGLVCILLVF